MSFLEIKNLSFSYEGQTVFNDLSVSMENDDHLVITGDSGAGKSTLLKVIAGLEVPTSGEVLLNGQVLCSSKVNIPPHLRGVGMVFQDFALFPHMTIEQNVCYSNFSNVDCDFWLNKIKLSHKKNSYPRELSGGEQQRVALARSLAAKPNLILLDEPFSNLDPALRAELEEFTYKILDEFKMASIQVTHLVDDSFQSQRKVLNLSNL